MHLFFYLYLSLFLSLRSVCRQTSKGRSQSRGSVGEFKISTQPPPPTRVHAKRANQKIAFEVDSLQRTTTAAAPLVCRRLIGRLTQSLFGARRFPSVGNRWCGGSCLMLTLTANRLVFVDISLIKRFRRLPSSNDDDEAENEPRFCISSP